MTSRTVTLAQFLRLCDALNLKTCEFLTEIRNHAHTLAEAAIRDWSGAADDSVKASLDPTASSTVSPKPVEPLQDAEVRQLIALARGLPPDTRRVFTLRKVYGLPPDAIASHLSLSSRDVARHLVCAARACALSVEPAPTRPSWRRIFTSD